MRSRKIHNKPKETNQKPAGGFLIAHFKRWVPSALQLNIGAATRCDDFLKAGGIGEVTVDSSLLISTDRVEWKEADEALENSKNNLPIPVKDSRAVMPP